MPVSRLLGLGQTRPKGILIAGAHDWGRELARVLQGLGRKVLLVDNNREHIHQARLEGLPTFYGSILSELTEERVELEGLGRLFALTGNDEINSLAAVNYSHLFGQENVYQLAPQHDNGQGDRLEVPERRQGQSLFSSWATSSYLTERFSRGATIKATRLSDQFTYDDLQAHYGGTAVPLLLVTPDGGLRIFTAGQGFTPESGQTLVSLVDPVDEKPDVRAQEQDDSLAGT